MAEKWKVGPETARQVNIAWTGALDGNTLHERSICRGLSACFDTFRTTDDNETSLTWLAKPALVFSIRHQTIPTTGWSHDDEVMKTEDHVRLVRK